jgi:hypothetical protein
VRALTVDLPVGLVHGEPVEREGAVAAANGKVDGDLRRIARVVGTAVVRLEDARVVDPCLARAVVRVDEALLLLVVLPLHGTEAADVHGRAGEHRVAAVGRGRVHHGAQRVELRVGERCGEHGGVGLRAVVPLLALERRVDALRDAGVVCGIDTVLERGCRL